MINENTNCPPGIPVHLWGGIKNYVLNHRPVGHFLTAVITNNLKDSVGRADATSLAALQDIVRYFYNETPSPCWGSVKEMKAWLADEEDIEDERR